MSQHDFVIDNATGAGVRSDINSALQALASSSAGLGAPGTTYRNQLWFDSTNGLLKIRNSANSAWITIGSLWANSWRPYQSHGASQAALIPNGTKMVFVQATAPTGWTQDTSQNDKVFRVVSGGSGGGTGGSWTISGVTINNHTLTAAESGLPTHIHGILSSGMPQGSGPSRNILEAQTIDNFHVTKAVPARNATSGHDHGLTANGNWRPAYQNVLVATKDA